MVDLESGSSSRDAHELYELHSDDNSLPLYGYTEQDATILGWTKDVFANPKQRAVNYITSLFPIAKWILHYNLAWLYADVVAGITVGVVMVPQSMSYAQLAGLPAQYGLYSAFVGVFIYCFFATSKDVSIGPVAVMSLEVSKVITRVQERNPDLTAPVIATVLAFICGVITLGLGIFRLGFILEFISMPAVLGFMSGSAFNIIVGQVPGLMGYSKLVNTRQATYQVVINSLKHLPDSNLNAVFGLIPLFILYAWKWICNVGPKRFPKYSRVFFYVQALRNGVVLVVFTVISWSIVRHPKSKNKVSVLGTVPSGLQSVGVMKLPDGALSAIAPELPAAVIILCLEHISIAKSFGRINDYKIVPDQELIAIGVTNLVGTFFNAYPATGSFSRSALKAKCNVKTPFAGIFTGACVLLALYCLTSAFYYIPKATLSAVIIHAVSDLITNYKVTWNLSKVSPIDCGIFLIAVLITVFSSIENGIYFAICASVAVLLFNLTFPNGVFLGRVKVAEIVNPKIIELDDGSVVDSDEYIEVGKKFEHVEAKKPKNKDIKYHTKWVPITKAVNSDVEIVPPPPGVVVFRPTESWTYSNCSRQFDQVFDEIRKVTRKGKTVQILSNIDRPWNDPGPLRLPWSKKPFHTETKVDNRPVLKVVAFDFSSVIQIDSTGVQTLVDLRKTLNKYADREVEYHFSGILSPWIRRSLINAGFGVARDGCVEQVSYVNVLEDSNSVLGYQSAVATNTPFFHLEMPSFDNHDTIEHDDAQ
jgi:sodium-independent sulfate anion transporter 11